MALACHNISIPSLCNSWKEIPLRRHLLIGDNKTSAAVAREEEKCVVVVSYVELNHFLCSIVLWGVKSQWKESEISASVNQRVAINQWINHLILPRLLAVNGHAWLARSCRRRAVAVNDHGVVCVKLEITWNRKEDSWVEGRGNRCPSLYLARHHDDEIDEVLGLWHDHGRLQSGTTTTTAASTPG